MLAARASQLLSQPGSDRSSGVARDPVRFVFRVFLSLPLVGLLLVLFDLYLLNCCDPVSHSVWMHWRRVVELRESTRDRINVLYSDPLKRIVVV